MIQRSSVSTLRPSCFLQEGAPVDDVQDEKGEREEESGDLVDVNGCCSALAAGVVLHGRRSDGASAPLGLVPHWRLLGRNTFNKNVAKRSEKI